MLHKYTPQQLDFLREIVQGRSRKEIVTLFNSRFDLALSASQIVGRYKRLGLNTGRDGRFKPGMVSPYKGKKQPYLDAAGKATRFKKGNRPWNYLPVGSERVTVCGYVEVKVADPGRWRQKHIVVWEEHNGPVPPGHAVIFGDGDHLNFDIGNLVLVTRGQLGVMNKFNLIQKSAELTRVGATIASLKIKIRGREKGKP